MSGGRFSPSRRAPARPTGGRETAGGGASSPFSVDDYWTAGQHQARGTRLLLWISLLAIGSLIAWASLAEIDEMVKGEGKVVPSQQVQVVQSLDGGIVKEILVRPGQHVEPGQVLLRIDPTRYSSSLGENRAEALALAAKAARLEALASGKPFVAPPQVEREAPQIIELEARIWQTKSREMEATVNIAREQLNQREQELRETGAKRDQAKASCDLTSRELQVTRPLLKTGAVSQVDLLRLERDVARYCGDQKAAEAQIDRLSAAIEEAKSKIEEAELNIRNQARSELSDTRAKLSALREGQLALLDKVKLSDIRSPVRGTVKSLAYNTIGGVVQPGKDILEIVPTDDTLLLEVRIHPRDIGFLRDGEEAEVKFTAYDFAIYGGLDGHVEQIGADTTVDEKGNAFYIVKVRTERNYVRDAVNTIIPGMVAEVYILTGKRTVMQYLLKPILRAKSDSLIER